MTPRDSDAGFRRQEATTTRIDRADPRLATRALLPPRYAIREEEKDRWLVCTDSPNLAVRIERGSTVSAASARKASEHTVFLDGAAQGEPFMDASRQVYNLDHHEGCVRAFTLATCEQAMVMVLKGLDLDGERWTLWANEPDLDTVLAIWVLLNHRRLAAEDPGVRRRAMPLVRLQGVIDAHGFELAELTGFPPSLQDETRATIDGLREIEVGRRADGSWEETDPLDYTLEALLALDEAVYVPSDFASRSEVLELERVPLTGDRYAIFCRSPLGIYEVEQELKEQHGDRLGLVLLERGEGAWTVRQTDPFLRVPLAALYERLNLVDPTVHGSDRWGGSSEIGGSPRRAGTGLSLADLVAVCRWVYRPPNGRDRIRAIVRWTVLAAACAVATFGLSPPGAVSGVLSHHLVANPIVAAGAVFAGAGALAFVLVARRLRRLSGLRRPGVGWWPAWAVPAAIAVAAGGGWGGDLAPAAEGQALAALVLGAIGTELFFRGAVLGSLASVARIMTPGGRQFVSMPAVVSAVLSGAVTWVLFPAQGVELMAVPAAAGQLGQGLAAVIVGVSCAFMRERSGSVWAPVGVHAALVAGWALLA